MEVIIDLELNNWIKDIPKDEINQITLKLNSILETMILKNPEQWIWTHNRWK